MASAQARLAVVLDTAVLPRAVDRRVSPPTRRAIDEAFSRVAGLVEGRVLDLADMTTGDLARLDAQGERFDSAVSVCRLAAEDDPSPLLMLVQRLIGDAGHLVFVEPSRPLGRRGAGARMAGPALAAGAGWRTDRDVVALLRSSGFTIGDIRRRDLPATAWPVRLLLEGRAFAAAGRTVSAPPGRSDEEDDT